MENPIVIENLKKSYGKVQAVDNVSLEVAPGEVFGLIGPDGAGKTTIIRILVSLLSPDSGKVFFLGKDVSKNPVFVRSHIGYMPQRFSLYRDLSVEQNLRFFGDLFHISRAKQGKQMEWLYNFSKLRPFKNRLAGALSGGMKQKLALSCMLMHEPEVIVLDEPTFGVDPVSRHEFWDILKTLAEHGITILVSTAYMDEANLCSRVALLHEGHILAMDKPKTLVQQFQHPIFRLESNQPYSLYTKLKTTEFADSIHLFGDGIHFSDKDQLGQRKIVRKLKEWNIEYNSIQPVQANLEDLFLERMR